MDYIIRKMLGNGDRWMSAVLELMKQLFGVQSFSSRTLFRLRLYLQGSIHEYSNAGSSHVSEM